MKGESNLWGDRKLTGVPELVAHRGESGDFPENTLLAMEKAFSAGGRWVECDIQLSSDLCPVLLHDHHLDRTTTATGYVWDKTAEQLALISAGYPTRFGSQFHAQMIPSLERFVALLLARPGSHALVELKRASIGKFSAEVLLDAVMKVLQPVRQRCLLISYDAAILAFARQRYHQAIGWVFDQITDTVKAKAAELKAELLITDASLLDAEQLRHFPSGTSQWCLFEVNQPELARRWGRLGIQYIETHRISTYRPYPEFFPKQKVDT